MDFWYFFTSLGIELLREKGLLSFIAPNNWTTTAGGKKMRNHIMKDMVIREFIDFGDYMIFNNASQQTMIFLLEKNKNQNHMMLNYSKVLDNRDINIKHFLKNVKNEKYVYSKVILLREEYAENSNLLFLLDKNENIIRKIKSNTDLFYLEDSEIAQGVVPNPDIINKRNITKLPIEKVERYKINIGDGVFVIPKNYFCNLNDLEKRLLSHFMNLRMWIDIILIVKIVKKLFI